MQLKSKIEINSSQFLEAFDRTILEISVQLRRKHKYFDFNTLYTECLKRLPNQERDILISINKLMDLKYLIQGFRINKEEILQNQTRFLIYSFIKKHPGIHFREIFHKFNIGGSIRRHLFMLKKFGIIRICKYLNKNCYFLQEMDEKDDLKYIVLRDELNREIYEIISENNRIRLTEISKILKLKHNKIQPHLEKLIDVKLIKKIEIDSTSYYQNYNY